MSATLAQSIPCQRVAVDVHAMPHGDPPTLTAAQLLVTHAQTLASPRHVYSLPARTLFVGMDLLYGRAGSESTACWRWSRGCPTSPARRSSTSASPGCTAVPGLPAGCGTECSSWAQQDNEIWHLLILSELVDRHGERDGWFGFRVAPRLMALGYWYFSWLLYALRPAWSHRLNADFEDHAEHEYAEFVRDNPALEQVPWSSEVCAAYGDDPTVARLLRQISHDERCHKRSPRSTCTSPRCPDPPPTPPLGRLVLPPTSPAPPARGSADVRAGPPARVRACRQ